ncbi:mCG1027381 [Mus musculus]|nr:mCG1027381 [Mus musculus]
MLITGQRMVLTVSLLHALTVVTGESLLGLCS